MKVLLQANAAAVAVNIIVTVLLSTATSRHALAHNDDIVHRGMGEHSVAVLDNPFFFPFLTEVSNGCEKEDEFPRYCGHFYNPELDKFPDFLETLCALFEPGPATDTCRVQYEEAVVQYNNDNLVASTK